MEAARADLEWTKNHEDEILGWLQNGPGGSTEPGGSTGPGGSTETDGSGSSEPGGSESTTTGGSGNIATNTIVITVAFIIALLHTTQIFNLIM